jgi:hypothetical protein
VGLPRESIVSAKFLVTDTALIKIRGSTEAHRSAKVDLVAVLTPLEVSRLF